MTASKDMMIPDAMGLVYTLAPQGRLGSPGEEGFRGSQAGPKKSKGGLVLHHWRTQDEPLECLLFCSSVAGSHHERRATVRLGGLEIEVRSNPSRAVQSEE
jgi:hypothetical protein